MDSAQIAMFSIWYSVIASFVIIAYSIYQLYLNKKQADILKVAKSIEQILLRMEAKNGKRR